jgi:hypothetical protein
MRSANACTEKASKKTARSSERAVKKTGKEIGKGAEGAGKGMKKAATKTADALKLAQKRCFFQSESELTARRRGLITSNNYSAQDNPPLPVELDVS